MTRKKTLFGICKVAGACPQGLAWARGRKMNYQTWRACPDWHWLDWMLFHAAGVIDGPDADILERARIAAIKLDAQLWWDCWQHQSTGWRSEEGDQTAADKRLKKVTPMYRKALPWREFKRILKGRLAL